MEHVLKVLTTCLGLCEITRQRVGMRHYNVRAWQNLSGTQAQFVLGVLDTVT